MNTYCSEWISIKDDPPHIGQRVIVMERYSYMVHRMVMMEDGWYFDYPDQKLNYRSAIEPEWWIPAPILPGQRVI